jgi:hypothetical protein
MITEWAQSAITEWAQSVIEGQSLIIERLDH